VEDDKHLYLPAKLIKVKIPILITQHVTAEIWNLRSRFDKTAFAELATLLRSGVVEERSYSLVDLGKSKRAISDLDRLGPTDIGLVTLAEDTKGILVSKESRLSEFAARMGEFVSLRHLENLLIRLSRP